MKKETTIVFTAILVTLMGAGIIPIASADGVTVSIGSGSAGVGETAVVSLMINNVDDLGKAVVNFTYNESVVNVTDVTNSAFQQAPNLYTRGPGWVVLQAGQLGGPALSGNVKMCDVTLEAVGNEGETSPLDLTDVELKTFSYPATVIPVDSIVNGTFAIQADGTKPIVKKSYTEPIVIPEDTDGVPLWGEMVTIDVTDDSAISTVRVDLSDMDGSAITNVSNAGNYSDGTFWCVFNVTNASVGTAKWNATSGTYESYYLPVNATDIYSNSNTSVSIELVVMKNGDIEKDGDVDFDDGLYLVRHALMVPGYKEELPVPDTIADVDGDGDVDFDDGLYLVRHALMVPGYKEGLH